MTIMADVPAAVTRPPLPRRPVPHERTPDRPTPAGPRPHPRQSATRPDTAARQLLDALYREHAPMAARVAAGALRARRHAVDHYRLARVRREEVTDYTDDLALAHLARLIGAAA
ncbi:hypothetical protein GCM10010377_68500 [Streptomyces viridiviolaceus]|uniref:Uncharacterized protein n=1 Tax=Streptomyces viridiviolaceus TaxID=68282 RepID=A0ABW2EBI5_9ACTN|nr:hypothetical protein [Streptomyces viridiviolaceus]GHB67886.1 hypothetical protein GCM10010377_68500 [Streptomyces viridiviolaceus]